MHRVCFLAIIAGVAPALFAAGESGPAILNARISASEDAPAVSSEYSFAPGDYLYFGWEISGFTVRERERGEIREISLAFEVTPQDEQGRPLAEPQGGQIKIDLSPEDKNWVPKRRVSFLLPPFLAAGMFRVHVEVKDEYARQQQQAARDFPFSVGGVHVKTAPSIAIENFRFVRREEDTEALSVPAYSPGDTVFARFDLTGFQHGSGNRHHVAYGVTVLGPDGKAFIQDPRAADLDDTSFYPAQFIPGNAALQMGKNNPRGQYIVVVKARDLLANREIEIKEPFSIE